MNSFFTSQFNYCPLVWMLYSRTMKNKINHLHERCLGRVYSDKTSSIEKHLETERSLSIHIRNLQIFPKETFKVSKDLAPSIFSKTFLKRALRGVTCVAFLSSLFQT